MYYRETEYRKIIQWHGIRSYKTDYTMSISVNMERENSEGKEIRIFSKYTINSINIGLIAHDYWEYIFIILYITYSKMIKSMKCNIDDFYSLYILIV